MVPVRSGLGCGYLAEPMVAYRAHELSMTKKLWKENFLACWEEDIRILWTLRTKAKDARFRSVEKACLKALIESYARNIVSESYRMPAASLDLEQFEKSLLESTADKAERAAIRAQYSPAWAASTIGEGSFYSQGSFTQPR